MWAQASTSTQLRHWQTLVLIDVDSLKFDSSMVLMAELFAKERANLSKSFKNSAAVVLLDWDWEKENVLQ